MTPVKPSKVKASGMPLWFNEHGNRVAWTGFDNAASQKPIMLLGSDAVEVKIYSYSGHGYIVEYKIVQSPDAHNSGKIWMSKEQIREAFGLSSVCPAHSSQWLADEYGADVAAQGKYIRYGQFLNIPGPGTGKYGDANVSILVNETMQAAIVEILFK
ncbi:MAG: hypothetical protein RIT04_397 [Candidatus Parcubacteria bacterium]